MNSAMMLTQLETTYPITGEPVVVIGLTTLEMFNPDVSWACIGWFSGHMVFTVACVYR